MPVLIRDNSIRVFVIPGDHDPMHVHVVDGELDVKIDTSGNEVCVLKKGRKHKNATNHKHTKRALSLCQSNLLYLRKEAQKHYV